MKNSLPDYWDPCFRFPSLSSIAAPGDGSRPPGPSPSGTDAFLGKCGFISITIRLGRSIPARGSVGPRRAPPENRRRIRREYEANRRGTREHLPCIWLAPGLHVVFG